MTPLDRRPQRLLAGICVAIALEQVEPLRKPLEQLLGREERRAGGGELDRERELVETDAELFDSRVGVKVGSTARARARKSAAPSCSARGGTGQVCSPPTAGVRGS